MKKTIFFGLFSGSVNIALPQHDFVMNLTTKTTNLMVNASHEAIKIRVVNDSLKHTSKCGLMTNSNGYDLKFTDNSDADLDFYVDHYDGDSGIAGAWVRLANQFSNEFIINCFHHSYLKKFI